MRRVGAVVGAIAMVAVAFVVRSALDDDGSGGGGGDGGPVRLACVDELADACRALAADDADVELTVASAGELVATFTDPEVRGEDAPYDAWATIDPLPLVVDARRDRAGDAALFGESTTPLAATRLVLVAGEDRAGALVTACGESSEQNSDDLVVSWRCVGDEAGVAWSELEGETGWGPFRPAFADPTDTASGLVVLGQAGTAYFGGPDYASNDFDAAFRSWLAGVEQAMPNLGGDPLAVLAQRGPAAYGAVGALEAEAEAALAGTRYEDDLRVLYPAPMATAVASLAPVEGSPGAEAATDLAEPLRDALAEEGWDVDDPEPAGLPSAGVLDALEQLWREVT